MRRSLFLPAFIAFSFALFLASCSGFKQMQIDKRHYRNGFYIHHTGSVNNDATVSANTKTATSVDLVPSAAMNKDNETAAIGNSNQAESNTASAVNVIRQVNAVSGSTENQPVLRKKEFVQEQLPLTIHHGNAASSSQPDDNTILLIILAIFLPWLAVLIYENGIDTKFWISLLLWFLFIIPGIIYAILVVTGNL